MLEIITFGETETELLGEQLAGTISAEAVIAFYGGLGMGKTAFCRGFLRGMDSKDDVSSPTFAILHEYRGRLPVYHFDMYRVEGFESLESTGFFDFLGTESVILVEWSENIDEFIPETAVKIEILRGEEDNKRIFKITGDINEDFSG